MEEKLQAIIKELQKVPVIRANHLLFDCLKKVEYYSGNENERAYLLGLFFKNRFDINLLPAYAKKLLQRSLKSSGLESYFYLKQQPENSQLHILSLIFFVGGILVTAAGLIQLINGNFWVGLGTKYLAFVVREGGQKMILGFLLFIGGLVRYKFEKRKREFIATLNTNPVLLSKHL